MANTDYLNIENLSSGTVEELIGKLNDVEKKNAPAIIYFSGDKGLFIEVRRIAIIGSRKASQRGITAASKLALWLSKNKITVVSGLAEGIDTAAHRGAIDGGGKTIAVIATPLDNNYPTANKDLQNLIAKNHLLISQFDSGTKLTPKNFILRNRTLALISDTVVIAEAQDNSGSINTAWEALRLKRPLWIMESVANDPKLKWPQEMLKYGANILSQDTLSKLLE